MVTIKIKQNLNGKKIFINYPMVTAIDSDSGLLDIELESKVVKIMI